MEERQRDVAGVPAAELTDLLKSRQYARAKELLKAHLKGQPSDFQALTQLALVLRELGDFSSAKKILLKILDTVHRGVYAHYILGTILLEEGRFAEAVKQFSQAVDSDAQDAYSWNGLALAHLRSGKPLEAERCLKRAIALDGNSPYNYNSLGLLYIEQSDFDRAENYLKQGLKATPRSSLLLETLGDLYRRRGDHAKARETFESLCLHYALDDRGHICLGNLALERGRPEEAIGHFQRALDRNSRAWQAMANLGMLHHEAGRLDEAQKAYLAALQVQPHNPKILASLASLFAQKGFVLRAWMSGTQAIAQKDDYAYAHYLMGKLYLSEQIPDKAEEELTRARALEGADLYTLTALAEAYLARRKLREARRILDEALESAPEDRQAQLLQGQLLLEEGRREEAKRVLKRLLRERGADPAGLRARQLLDRA